ncbi:MAG: ABC transporter substrate-binding protein [Actinomycetota bacterium]
MTNGARTRILAAAGALLLISAACGTDDATSDGSPSDSDPQPVSTTAEAPGTTLGEPPAVETKVFVDDLGREVEVPVNPQRVVFANGELAGMATTLGYQPLALHDSYSSSEESLQALGGLTPDLGQTTFLNSEELNLEALKALEPDLLIWTPWLEPGDYDVIADEIAPVVALEARANGTDAYTPGEDQGEQYSKQRKVAELVGVADALDGQIAAYESQVDDVRERHGDLIDQLEWTMLDLYGDGLAWMYGQPAMTLNEVTVDIGLDPSTAMTEALQSPDNETYLYASISAERVPEFAADLVIVLVEDPTQSVADIDSGIDTLLSSTDAGAAGQVLVGDQLGWLTHNVQANMSVLEEIDAFLSEQGIANVGDF